MTTRLIELIYTEREDGAGTAENPCCIVRQLWTKDGCLVADSRGLSRLELINEENS